MQSFRFQVSGKKILTPRVKLRQNGIVSLLIRLAIFQASGGARMKLRQNGIVSFSIKLAAFQAGGRAEPLNLEPLNALWQFNGNHLPAFSGD